MKTMTIEKQVLQRIHKEKLKPTPKSFFKVRDFVLWMTLGIFVAALSVGFGMIIFMVKGTDTSLFDTLGLSAYERIAYSIPTFWIVASLIVGLIAYFNLQKTRNGYRVGGRRFTFIALMVSVGIGSVAYALNITEYLNDAASHHLPLYNTVVPLNTASWFDPEHGLLSGVVREKESDDDFTLRDSDSVLWHVTGSHVVVTKGFVFHSGDRIKLIGTQTAEDSFTAIEIRPWEEAVVIEQQ